MSVVPDSLLQDAARRFALLSDPTRLKIVSVLHGGGDCTVSEIAQAAGTSVANASQHLQRLANGGIVDRRRNGQAVRYQIVDGTIASLCVVVCDGLAAKSGAGQEVRA